MAFQILPIFVDRQTVKYEPVGTAAVRAYFDGSLVTRGRASHLPPEIYTDFIKHIATATRYQRPLTGHTFTALQDINAVWQFADSQRGWDVYYHYCSNKVQMALMFATIDTRKRCHPRPAVVIPHLEIQPIKTLARARNLVPKAALLALGLPQAFNNLPG
jgi:hypothetical protein